MTAYVKTLNKIQNISEERESKMAQLIKIAQNNNLTLLESQGLPLMVCIRKLTVQLSKEIKQNLMIMIN